LYAREGAGGVRYHLYESVRVFAAERWAGLSAPDAVQRRFVEHFLGFSERAFRAHQEDDATFLGAPDEAGNTWRVIDLAEPDTRIGWALVFLFEFGDFHRFGPSKWIDEAQKVPTSDPAFRALRRCRKFALMSTGGDRLPLCHEVLADPTATQLERAEAQRDVILTEAGYSRAGHEQANAFVEAQLSQVTEETELSLRAWLLMNRGVYLSLSGSPMAAVERLRESKRLYTLSGPPKTLRTLLGRVGVALLYAGQLEEAEDVLTEYLDWAASRKLFVGGGAQTIRLSLGTCHALRGQFFEAANQHREGVLEAESMGVRNNDLMHNLASWATCTWLQGDETTAYHIFTRHPLPDRMSDKYFGFSASLFALYQLHQGAHQEGQERWEKHAEHLVRLGYPAADWKALWNAHQAVADERPGWEETVAALCARPAFWLPRQPRPDTGQGGVLLHVLFVVALEELVRRKNPTRP